MHIEHLPTLPTFTTCCWTTINRRMLEPTKKRNPTSKDKGETKSVGRGTIMFKINPNTLQRHLEGTNKNLCTPGPRERSSDPHKRLSQTCLWVLEGLLQRHGSAVACGGDRDSGSSRPGRRGLWHKSFWRGSSLAPLQSRWERSSCTVAKVLGSTTDFPTWILDFLDPGKGLRIPRESDFEGQWDLITELPQDRRNKTLGGHKQNLMHTRTQEKGAVTPQETEPDLPVSVWESPAEVWVNSELQWGQGHWIQQS